MNSTELLWLGVFPAALAIAGIVGLVVDAFRRPAPLQLRVVEHEHAGVTRYPFRLCFEAHRDDGNVWAVDYRSAWHLASMVKVLTPCKTVYLEPGPTEPDMPAAYLMGTAATLTREGTLVILA